MTHPYSNVYKILEVTKIEEALTSTLLEKVNQGKEKKIVNSQEAKDAQNLLKCEYKHRALNVMDY